MSIELISNLKAKQKITLTKVNKISFQDSNAVCILSRGLIKPILKSFVFLVWILFHSITFF